MTNLLNKNNIHRYSYFRLILDKIRTGLVLTLTRATECDMVMYNRPSVPKAKLDAFSCNFIFPRISPSSEKINTPPGPIIM